MKRLLVLAGLFLALITTVTDTAQAGHPSGVCRAPIIVSN